MTDYLSDAEARVALHDVERARQRVIDQIGMPKWYWWGLAACWIALGVLNDVANAWIVAVATIVFGCLVGLGGVTIAAALAAYADGAEHPATMASVLVAVIILLGGPRVMAAIRAGATRRDAVR